MSTKEWYRLLLEKNVTKREIDQEGRLELIPCRVEEKEPQVFWSESYRISRLTGLSPGSKSFLFRLLHTLIPSRERVHQLGQEASPLCWCNTGAVENYQHRFYQCRTNSEAGQALLQCAKTYDRNLTEVKSMRLELTADDPFLMPTIAILTTGLEFIWENRKLKKPTALYTLRAELELAVSIRRKSSSRRVREAASIMINMILNCFH